MDVSELRKRILRALDDARKEASTRRAIIDDATRAYGEFLERVAVPLLRQAETVLKSEGQLYTVHAPAGSARLVSAKTSETFIEIALDTTGERPQVIGRISIARGRDGRVEEYPIAPDKAIGAITDEDLSQLLVRQIPRLILKP
jgi:hypothetical protein